MCEEVYTCQTRQMRVERRDEGSDWLGCAFERGIVGCTECDPGRVHKDRGSRRCRCLEAAGRRLRGRAGVGERRERRRPCVRDVRRR